MDNLTVAIFAEALSSLKESLSASSETKRYFSESTLEDIQKTRIVESALMPDDIYDHRSHQGEFIISEKLFEVFAKFWGVNSISAVSKERMCKLFFLHEFYHLNQGIDSNTYAYTRNTKNIINRLDYVADAKAVELLYLLEKDSSSVWNEQLAAIIADHILGGEVFSFADDKRDAAEIEGGRLRRQLIWHLQYARAKSFRTESGYSQFNIDNDLTLEVLKIERIDRRTNLTNAAIVSADDLMMTEFHIIWNDNRIIYEFTLPRLTELLKRAIFESNFDCSALAFRSLFHEHPELVGRSKVIAADEGKLKTNWQKIEDLVITLMPEGPNKDEFWSRAGGNKSMLRSDGTGKAQWHNAINLLKNGGGGITVRQLLEAILQDFPENTDANTIASGRVFLRK